MTRLAGSEQIGWADTPVDKAGWYAKADAQRFSRKALSKTDLDSLVHKLIESVPHTDLVPVSLPYVKLTALFDAAGILSGLRILGAMPDVSVISVVRPNWNLKALIATNMNVSHQGIVVRKADGQIYLRHASSAANKVVSEVLFVDYLKHFIQIPTIRGFNVLSVKN